MMQGALPDSAASRVGEFIGACALLLLVLPLMVLVTIAIKSESPGPIFVRAKRVAGDRQYIAFKFRCTQCDDSFGHPTRVGWFLRRTNIENLPQLYNVLRGEMSCLNPRPGAPFFLS
jgi:lipopolysaccharide/colanic/teichoic acid biosynthesis glycosyltransferase